MDIRKVVFLNGMKLYRAHKKGKIQMRFISRVEKMIYLSHLLEAPLKVIHSRYVKLPLMREVMPSDINETVHFLREIGFEKLVIADSCTICNYPVENIERGLKTISENEDIMSKIGIVNGFTKGKKTMFTNGILSEDKRLELCLYYMELPFGFTGQGSLVVHKIQ